MSNLLLVWILDACDDTRLNTCRRFSAACCGILFNLGHQTNLDLCYADSWMIRDLMRISCLFEQRFAFVPFRNYNCSLGFVKDLILWQQSVDCERVHIGIYSWFPAPASSSNHCAKMDCAKCVCKLIRFFNIISCMCLSRVRQA